ncbi:SRPBCC family protein [Rhodococcus cercidiphylli]|uniref:Carbon monoxide dehydrogenase subunit G n=1 Tax=Rhodococcus cercidiphylli TaxID=489916 RepID=A0ABU4B3J1_9NOCA|nr:carbon monoxide dehydrogenase subunit G [Rhodococcus cercidiphylli]MDV6233049.1 carbon monoxide dehydrogenase subunit G [Rhodococcus cercidiphylli]
MRIAGTATLTAPPAEVYDSMQDGRVLAATIPGVQSLEQLSDDHYKLSITAGVAAIKGTYDGEVLLSQQNRPESFVMTASGAGAPGTVRADVTIKLEQTQSGGTLLSYDADAVVGGMVGGVGQRMITGVAKKMAGVFFNGLDGVIANGVPEASASAAASPADAAGGSIALPVAAAGGRSVGAGAPVAAPSVHGALIAAAAGASIALAGVVLGSVLTRSSCNR